MRTTLQADWVGPDCDMRHLDSELLDIFFACDEEPAHEALGEIEELILDSAAALHWQIRKEVRCETIYLTSPATA